MDLLGSLGLRGHLGKAAPIGGAFVGGLDGPPGKLERFVEAKRVYSDASVRIVEAKRSSRKPMKCFASTKALRASIKTRMTSTKRSTVFGELRLIEAKRLSVRAELRIVETKRS